MRAVSLHWDEFPELTKSSIRDWQYKKHLQTLLHQLQSGKVDMFANLNQLNSFWPQVYTSRLGGTLLVFRGLDLTVKNGVAFGGLIQPDFFPPKNLFGSNWPGKNLCLGTEDFLWGFKSGGHRTGFHTWVTPMAYGGNIHSKSLRGWVPAITFGNPPL